MPESYSDLNCQIFQPFFLAITQVTENGLINFFGQNQGIYAVDRQIPQECT